MSRITTLAAVYIGNAIVRNQEGTCHVLTINTRFEDVEIELPPQELDPFEYGNPDEDNSLFDSSDTDQDVAPPIDRIGAIMGVLRLDRLSGTERTHVSRLIEEFPYRFKLPGDKLQ